MKNNDRKSYLLHLFTFEKPYALSYQYRKKSSSYKQDKPVLRDLIKEGLIEQVFKNTKEIEFRYIGPLP
jgi:hypothetical protein